MPGGEIFLSPEGWSPKVQDLDGDHQSCLLEDGSVRAQEESEIMTSHRQQVSPDICHKQGTVSGVGAHQQIRQTQPLPPGDLYRSKKVLKKGVQIRTHSS